MASPPVGQSSAAARNHTLPAAWRRLLRGNCEAGTTTGRGTRDGDSLGFLFELIRPPHAQAASLEAAPVLLEKTGKRGPVRIVALDDLRLAQAALPVVDQRLASCVLGLPHAHRKNRTYAALNGEIGDVLLNEMLDTVPCFLGGVAGLRLARGRQLALDWIWHLHEDGSQRLIPALAPAHNLIRVGDLWYLDAQNALLCPLAGSATEIALLDAPPLAPEDCAAMSAALAASPMAQRIPPPRVFDTIRTADQPPQPVLTLHSMQQRLPAATCADGDRPDATGRMATRVLAYARLGFAYAGVHLPTHAGECTERRIAGDGSLIEIQRHRAEELASMERLEGIGLRPAVDTEGLPWEVADALPDDAWLFPGAGHDGALEVNTSGRWLTLRPRLQHEGFILAYATSFPVEVVEGETRWYAAVREDQTHDAFALDIGIEVEGKRINVLPAVTRALNEGQLSLETEDHEQLNALWYAPIDARRRVPLRLHDLRRILAPVSDALHSVAASVSLCLPRVQAGRIEELARVLPERCTVHAPPNLRHFTRRLRTAAQRANAVVSPALEATLRDYQRDGLAWLDALARAGIGGVLADDMGLGKTLQLLAHVQALKDAGDLEAPALVAAPTSLLPNWQTETARFAPGLRQLTLHGPQRAGRFSEIDGHDLVLTSYALLSRDLEALKLHRFSLIAADEAQQVKNPRTQARKALRALQAPRRICLSGTPLENHLGELWSQMDLAVPGLLGDESCFRRHYRTPIEKHHDADVQQRLNRRIAPFILRRTKAEVASELPPKTEITRRVVLEGRQRALYESLRLDISHALRETIARRGMERSGIAVLDALLKLRQVCCDPRLVKLEEARKVSESAKFDLLMEMLPSLVAEGRRVLVFSQFTSMLSLIAEALRHHHIEHVTLTGNTRDRGAPVRRFQDGEVPLFLLSLKAGGVGLNLTAADTVIHYDPWWNPAAEAQASDRAHRIGQDKPVFVYRLITADTVEERIEIMKARKAELAEAVLSGGGTRQRLRFEQEDLDALLAPP